MKKLNKMLGMTMALTLAFTLSPVMEKQAAASTLTPALAKTPGNNNPLFSQKFGADPYAMVYNGRVYVYMTNDVLEYNADGTVKDNGYGKINKITVVSSDDMVNWTDHGEILVAGPQGAAKWANNSWAPAAAHKTIDGKEKFFLYFADNGSGIGVLTADSPIGPFTDPIGKQLVSRSTPGASDVTWLFDPAVLVDDDGSGYLYFGGGIPAGKDADPGTARVAKLGADMISLDLSVSGGTLGRINPPWLFEDSGIHKYNGKYYYSYCTNFSSGHPSDIPTGAIGYMVSDNPMGPFTFVKTILPNPATFFGAGGNNHHAIFEFNNQWYVTYHAQTVAKAMAESGMYPQMGGQPHGYRNTNINKVSFDANGVINPITGDYAGVPQLQNLNPYTRVEAETIGWNGGISTETTTQPGGMVSSVNLAVSIINDGDWTAVSKVDFGATGAGTFKANVASSGGGNIELHLDSATGPLIGTLPISNTGGDDVWKTKTTSVSGATGVHNVFMVYTGASTGNLFKVDSWQFEQKTAAHDLVAINASIDKQKIDTVSGTNQANLKVSAIYADGTSADISAQALATPAQSGIVSVNNGVVTGVGYGSTSIDISYGGKTDTVNMLVKDLNSELTVKKITIDNGSVTLDSGKTATFKVTAEYVDGHTEDVTKTATYTNPSPAIAEVAGGTITAKASGTANVTVSFKGALGAAATSQISVLVNTPSVVAIEAETAAENTVNAYVYGTINGHTWSLVDGQSTKAMFFGPNTVFTASGTDAASLAANSRLGYKVNFPTSGTYNVWILVKTLGYDSDSIHVGLDNQYKFTTNGIEGLTLGPQYKWANISGSSGGMFGGATLNVTAGVHELNFWGREDGLAIDRIYLTTSNATTDPVWPQPLVPTATISADSSVQPGSSFTVAVSADNVTQSVYAQDITISYDSNVFDYVSAVGANNNIQIVSENKDTVGKVRLMTANTGVGISGVSTPVLNLTFKVKAGVQNTSGTIAATQAKFGVAPEGTVIDAALGSKSISVGAIAVVKTALTTAITDAQSLYDGAVVGTANGQYPQAAKDAFGAALTAAKAVRDSASATQSQVDSAVTALGSARSTFRAAVIVVVIDKTALTTAITDAQSLYDGAVVGTAAGQYPQAAKDAFDAALTAAKAVRDSASATQSQVDSSVTALSSAVAAFKAAVIKSVDLNNDGSIDVGDLAIVAYNYGKDSNSTDWTTAKKADMNNDNKIDIFDLAYVASKILQ
ncbi:carbohydrate-binding protein [Paenibacillus sp. Soil750]|uniref:carbohydrate-binding protein n=1 Tax=Paenibacillus sp. Soil750 TaxID=1736398 RepID=UPI0007C6D971